MHPLPDKIFQIISSYELVGTTNLPLMQEYAFNFDWATPFTDGQISAGMACCSPWEWDMPIFFTNFV